MPTTMTLDGVRANRARTFLSNLVPRRRRYLGDAQAPAGPDPWAAGNAFDMGPSPSGEFLRNVLGWGILAFAVGTAGYRGWEMVQPHVSDAKARRLMSKGK